MFWNEVAFPPGSGSHGQVVPGGRDGGEEVGTSVTPIQALMSLLKSLGCPSLKKIKRNEKRAIGIWFGILALSWPIAYALVILSKMLYLC